MAKIKQVDEEVKKLPVSIKGKYLPSILVKLGEFFNNAEARRYIRNTGVVVNGTPTTDIDYELNIGNVYEIKVKGVTYDVTIL